MTEVNTTVKKIKSNTFTESNSLNNNNNSIENMIHISRNLIDKLFISRTLRLCSLRKGIIEVLNPNIKTVENISTPVLN
jgi:hypothetical protein